MQAHEIKNLLLKTLNLEKLYVLVDGDHYRIIAIDKIFIGKSILEQHQIIYAPLIEWITSNKIHSVSIHAFCPKEWHNQSQLYNI